MGQAPRQGAGLATGYACGWGGASFPAQAVNSTKQALDDLTLPGAGTGRADAARFPQLARSDAVKARLASLFAPGLQTSGPLGLKLGDCLGSL